LKVMRR